MEWHARFEDAWVPRNDVERLREKATSGSGKVAAGDIGAEEDL